jgi:hypothetical protein
MQRRFRATTRGRVLARVRRQLRSALDARRRRHVADVRFFELLSKADGTIASMKRRE